MPAAKAVNPPMVIAKVNLTSGSNPPLEWVETNLLPTFLTAAFLAMEEASGSISSKLMYVSCFQGSLYILSAGNIFEYAL